MPTSLMVEVSADTSDSTVNFTMTTDSGNILVTEDSQITFSLPAGFKWPQVGGQPAPISITRTDNGENVTADFHPTVNANKQNLTISDDDSSVGSYWNYTLTFTDASGRNTYTSDPRIYNRPG